MTKGLNRYERTGSDKKYTIGHQTERGRDLALRDVLAQNARALWRTTADLLRGKPIIQGNHLEEVWALKDVSFEIRRGEFAPNYGIIETKTGVEILMLNRGGR